MSQRSEGRQDKPQSKIPDQTPSIRSFEIKRADSKELVGEDYFQEKILHVDPRFIGRIFSVEVQKVRLPDGRETTREIVRHPGGACVVALDADDTVYLVHQYRVGTGGPLREIPAGKLEPPEDALSCARRELAEETGIVADRWDLLTRFNPSPGYTDEIISIYLARGLSQGYAQPDEGEFISCERILLYDALEEVRQGTLTDGKTCLGILLTADLIGYTRL